VDFSIGHQSGHVVVWPAHICRHTGVVTPIVGSESAASPKQTRDPDRKNKILSAAADLVAQRGFHAVSMSDIGVEVGISGTAIYRHFKSKSALLVAMFDRSIDELLEDERESRHRSGSLQAALQHLIDRQVDFVVNEREFARVYHREVDHLPEDDQARLRRKQRLYLEEWVHLVRELHAGMDDATARIIVHAAIGAIQSPLVHNVGMPDAQLKEELTRAAYAVLRVDTGAA
jgi:AcrR family transcriptional regulator